jgi:glycerol uptake facilitator-like aquaporin
MSGFFYIYVCAAVAGMWTGFMFLRWAKRKGIRGTRFSFADVLWRSKTVAQSSGGQLLGEAIMTFALALVSLALAYFEYKKCTGH